MTAKVSKLFRDGRSNKRTHSEAIGNLRSILLAPSDGDANDEKSAKRSRPNTLTPYVPDHPNHDRFLEAAKKTSPEQVIDQVISVVLAKQQWHGGFFTLEQVQSVLRAGLEEQQLRLMDEFKATTRELLQEQFESFTNFNHDYISRQFTRSHSSYIS